MPTIKQLVENLDSYHLPRSVCKQMIRDLLSRDSMTAYREALTEGRHAFAQGSSKRLLIEGLLPEENGNG